MRMLSRIRRSSNEKQEGRILKSSWEEKWPVLSWWKRFWTKQEFCFYDLYKRNSQMFRCTRVCRLRAVWPKSAVFASYLCQTARHLRTRMSENLGISPLTDRKSSNLALSNIFSHLDSTGHVMAVFRIFIPGINIYLQIHGYIALQILTKLQVSMKLRLKKNGKHVQSDLKWICLVIDAQNEVTMAIEKDRCHQKSCSNVSGDPTNEWRYLHSRHVVKVLGYAIEVICECSQVKVKSLSH